MQRQYKDGERTVTPQFFIGKEVENTLAYSLNTLFCRGDVSLSLILDTLLMNPVSHVYLNSNHTKLIDAEHKIESLLKAGYWVTVEYNYGDTISTNSGRKFIPLISIPIPNIKKINRNLSIKFDDVGFNVTNPGVWTIQLATISPYSFTSWDKYNQDKVIE